MSKEQVTAILVPCSAAKSASPSAGLVANVLQHLTQEAAQKSWAIRLSKADPTVRACDYYVGRGFKATVQLSQRAEASLYIVSSGLGLLPANKVIPPYDLTTTESQAAVQRYISGSFDKGRWWAALQQTRFSISIPRLLKKHKNGVLLLCLTEQYAGLLAEALGSLKDNELSRFRIVGAGLAKSFEPRVMKCVMPYDHRLATIAPGAMAEFCHRAARHFLGLSLSLRSPDADASAVLKALEGVNVVPRPIRHKASDSELRALIGTMKVQGSIANRLKVLRNQLGVACEAGRFSRLVREVAAA